MSYQQWRVLGSFGFRVVKGFCSYEFPVGKGLDYLMFFCSYQFPVIQFWDKLRVLAV